MCVTASNKSIKKNFNVMNAVVFLSLYNAGHLVLTFIQLFCKRRAEIFALVCEFIPVSRHSTVYSH